MSCHVCGSKSIKLVPGYEKFHRVTSDCKPWNPGGKLVSCDDCGCCQAALDETWHSDAKQIYRDYTIYHQSQGAEQSVYDQASGQAWTRSVSLVKRLHSEISISRHGRLLDIGCGNGAMLRAFGETMKEWSMAGVEVNDHYRSLVESIPNVERLYTGNASDIPGQFDAISLIHVLEHIPFPREFLIQIWDKLAPGGLLLIQVPDCSQNPFMFLVADHASHFFKSVLKEMVESVGYQVKVIADDWVAKELTVVAYKASNDNTTRSMNLNSEAIPNVISRLFWLSDLVKTTRDLGEQGKLGLFGTSIAATWLFAELNGKVAFFVDEDPNRIGKTHLDLPIFAPGKVPPDSEVFVPLPPFLAKSVAARLSRFKVKFHLPAELPSSQL